MLEHEHANLQADLATGLTPMELLEREIRQMGVELELSLGQDITQRHVLRRMERRAQKALAFAKTAVQ